MLPKELMDDCNCLQNQTTPKPSDNITLSNETMATMDPLIREMLNSDPRFNSNIDRSTPAHKPSNGNHFTSTPKPVSFKSFWDDIFGSPTENATDITTNVTQTTISDGNDTNASTPPIQNTTDLPFIWDFLTTETPRTSVNQTTDSFTNKPTIGQNDTLLPQSMSYLRQFTPGVVYDDINGTTITVNVTNTSDTASTPPSSSPPAWTRPFYRPQRIRNQTATTAQNITAVTETPLTIGSSYFRPTLKPILRPNVTTIRDESHPEANTVPPYDRRFGLIRDRMPSTEFQSRSRTVSQPPNEQLRDDNPYVEQRIEPQFSSNRTQYPYERESNYTAPQTRLRPASQTYQPQDQPQVYGSPDAQPSPYFPRYNRAQEGNILRPTFDPKRNISRDSPIDQSIEQKPYSPTSWSHQQNQTHPDSSVYSPQPPQRTADQSREPKKEAQHEWWDSRYDPETYPMRAPDIEPQQPVRPSTSDARGRQPSGYPQTSQTRFQRPVLTPGVVYSDEQQNVPQYRLGAKTGLTRPYYPPNTTYPRTYPQSPYYRQQPSVTSRKTQIPSREVYSRPELIDRSYVPQYNPYMTDISRPQMPQIPQIVVGEYPPSIPVYNIDHSYRPRVQYMPIDPYRSQRVDPFGQRPQRPSKTGYSDIRRRGDKPFRRTMDPMPQSVPEIDDLKTISEIMESPDLMIGQSFKTFNTLKDLVNGSGLWDALNRPTTYITIFMPTDDAFNFITDGSVEQLKRNPKLVKDFLTQHILGYSLPPKNLKNNMRVKSLNGEMHLINVIEGGKVSLVFQIALNY